MLGHRAVQQHTFQGFLSLVFASLVQFRRQFVSQVTTRCVAVIVWSTQIVWDCVGLELDPPQSKHSLLRQHSGIVHVSCVASPSVATLILSL